LILSLPPMGNGQTHTLEVVDLWVSVDGKPILKGVDLKIQTGEIHAVMGPNGSGKSTLANVIMGHPRYRVERGDIRLDGESIIGLTPDKRARRGLFLAFQYPVAISGVTLFNFLRAAYNATRPEGMPKPTIVEFRKIFREGLQILNMDEQFGNRYVNDGWSGGEKKKGEVFQMSVLAPRFAILDETDSGLDIDALKWVASGIAKLAGPDRGILLITHYNRILQYIRPHRVHVLVDGTIALSGGPELADQLEERGYGWVVKE
jgi:Fe-S cluster assembly ATP-binding protein